MDEYRHHQQLTADPTVAIAYARIADLHASARQRRRLDPQDPRVHPAPGLILRLRAWWRRGPTGVVATQVKQRAKKSGVGQESDLPSLLRC